MVQRGGDAGDIRHDAHLMDHGPGKIRFLGATPLFTSGHLPPWIAVAIEGRPRGATEYLGGVFVPREEGWRTPLILAVSPLLGYSDDSGGHRSI